MLYKVLGLWSRIHISNNIKDVPFKKKYEVLKIIDLSFFSSNKRKCLIYCLILVHILIFLKTKKLANRNVNKVIEKHCMYIYGKEIPCTSG